MRWVSEPPVVRVSVTHSIAEIQVHPDNVSLFGGVAGAVLGVDEFEICDGLVLRKTYAHVMSPYVLAFHRPESHDTHHPGPWKSARGGVWLDVEVEIALQQGVRPTGFDRLKYPVVDACAPATVDRSAVESACRLGCFVRGRSAELRGAHDLAD